MKFQPLTLLPALCAILLLAQPPVFGETSFRGPLPEEQREIIRYMADHHDELKRTVEFTDDGYTAVTTTENQDLAAKLKEHFSYMEKRLDSGSMVRRWDPAFAELTEYYDQLETDVAFLDNGIQVTVTGKTPEAAKVARNHARIVTVFTEKGSDAVRSSHEAAIQESESSE